ncbi:hypothetical protein T01_15408, partial [Trichinella spiralis]
LFVFHWWLICRFVHSYKVNNTMGSVVRRKMAAMPC